MIAEKEKINMRDLSTHSKTLQDVHIRSFDIKQNRSIDMACVAAGQIFES